MTTEELKRLSWRFDDEVFNKGNLAVVDELVSPDFVNRTPLPGEGADREALRDYVPAFRAGFPDLRCRNELMLADGDLVAHVIVFEGTHTGAFGGAAPTGRRVTIRAHDFQRWRDGRMTERWSIADTAELDAIFATATSDSEADGVLAGSGGDRT